MFGSSKQSVKVCLRVMERPDRDSICCHSHASELRGVKSVAVVTFSSSAFKGAKGDVHFEGVFYNYITNVLQHREDRSRGVVRRDVEFMYVLLDVVPYSERVS